jgi:DNA-binding HxlR family transcriptional regulator
VSRTRFDEENCSVARALEALGDWWTLLIIRECFLGTRRFGDFESKLGIAKNILSKRLQHLVEHEILRRVEVGQRGQRFEYELTARGRDLATLMTALRQWGDRWVFGEGHEPIVVRDRLDGKPIPRLRVADRKGRPIPGNRLEVVAGPGASRETLERFES